MFDGIERRAVPALAVVILAWFGPLYRLVYRPTPPDWAVLAVWVIGMVAAGVVMYGVRAIGSGDR